MSSQASSAGNTEAKVRQKLIESGHVDIMIAIRSNFFYTRSVPCELWFFDKDKPQDMQDKVLMIDAREIYRKVTRRIFDFSPEQQQNILSIIWLYRGQKERFHQLVINYITKSLSEAQKSPSLIQDYKKTFNNLDNKMQIFLNSIPKNEKTTEIINELEKCRQAYLDNSQLFAELAKEKNDRWQELDKENIKLTSALEELNLFSEENKKLIKEAEMMYRLINRLVDDCLQKSTAKNNSKWNIREIQNLKKETEEARDNLVNQFKKVRYFYHQAQWLLERFPDAQYRDVEGLVKLVDKEELKENDWSLTPGRYVGVAPEEEDPDFDFEETMRNIHAELEELNIHANELAEKINENFRKLGI
jgi:type I restriction enzyme M protein